MCFVDIMLYFNFMVKRQYANPYAKCGAKRPLPATKRRSGLNPLTVTYSRTVPLVSLIDVPTGEIQHTERTVLQGARGCLFLAWFRFDV